MGFSGEPNPPGVTVGGFCINVQTGSGTGVGVGGSGVGASVGAVVGASVTTGASVGAAVGAAVGVAQALNRIALRTNTEIKTNCVFFTFLLHRN